MITYKTINHHFDILQLSRYQIPLVSKLFGGYNFNKRMDRGKFIVVEGLDRTGKSSVTQLLSQVIGKNEETINMAFPNRSSKIGMILNDFLLSKVEMPHQAVHLLFSANRWESVGAIEQALESGKIVICDRYWYSGVAYSHAKGLDLQWCISSDKGLIEPDLILYINGTPELLAQRSNYGKQRFEQVQFQKRVSEGFRKVLATTNQDIIEIIEADGKSLPAVQKKAVELVTQRLRLSPD